MMSRFFRHLFTTRAAAKRAFSDAALGAIEARIAEGEKNHRAEVRVIIEAALSFSAILDKTTPRERALDLFGRYGIWDTEDNSGVLLYINLADQQVEIVADRGIAGKVAQTEWEDICSMMTCDFAQNRFQEGALKALSAVNHLLARHFPLSGPRENQLPDHPVLL